ncbi:hypothetical protein VTP01DRAFT_1899 [Rhizomucor pusillus]|uniref:uncharacterized protein n=1 Tax=Rhizomucor pusillus TaxID=4840 RepID=UPI003743C979
MSKAQKEQDDERKDTPVAPPVPPPTPPQSSRNPSSLLSPWWSAEPPPERPSDAKKNHYVFMNFSVTTSAKKPGTEGNTPEDQVVLTKESCFMLAKKEALQNQPDDAPANSPYVGTSDCRMICFLRESEHLLKLREAEQHQQQQRSWNPFRGTWLVVATTRQRCMEHSFSDDKRLPKKHNHPDYYTVDLGEMLSGSGEDVKRIVAKSFTPMQELSKRYIESWKDGTQAAFFSRFYESAKRGDAFRLVRDNSRRLFNAVVGDDDKDSNQDNKRR